VIRARGTFALWTALSSIAIATTVGALLVALSRVDYTMPALAELAAACQAWALPHADLASLLVVALTVPAVAATGLSIRSASRQVGAARRHGRRLDVVGRLHDAPHVQLVTGSAPCAFCAGWLRPRVFMSTGALMALSIEEREAVVAHELHHARRRDPLRLLVARSLGEGLFFLPAVGRLAERYASLAELAADEAAERATGGRKALASAMLAFDAHPHPAVVGISPERVDRLLGVGPRWELPMLLLAGTVSALAALGGLAARLLQIAGHQTVALPAIAADLCMVAMTAGPVLLAAGALLAGTRDLRRRTSVSA
jgi:hypothetical protein